MVLTVRAKATPSNSSRPSLPQNAKAMGPSEAFNASVIIYNHSDQLFKYFKFLKQQFRLNTLYIFQNASIMKIPAAMQDHDFET